MIILGIFLLLIFVYSLFARRIEESVFTSPIIFTTVGILLGLILPHRSTQFVAHEAALLVAETECVKGYETPKLIN